MHGDNAEKSHASTDMSLEIPHVLYVRFCSCVIPVSFILYLCSVAVHSRLNWVALVIVDCSHDALQPIRVHYEFEVYGGICASIYLLVVMYVELLASRFA